MSFYELLQKKLLQNLSRYGYPATDEEHAKFNIRFFKDNEVTDTPNYLRSCCKVFRLYTMIRDNQLPCWVGTKDPTSRDMFERVVADYRRKFPSDSKQNLENFQANESPPPVSNVNVKVSKEDLIEFDAIPMETMITDSEMTTTTAEQEEVAQLRSYVTQLERRLYEKHLENEKRKGDGQSKEQLIGQMTERGQELAKTVPHWNDEMRKKDIQLAQMEEKMRQMAVEMEHAKQHFLQEALREKERIIRIQAQMLEMQNKSNSSACLPSSEQRP